MIQPKPFKNDQDSNDFNTWIENLRKEHRKIRNILGSTSHICSRNEFK